MKYASTFVCAGLMIAGAGLAFNGMATPPHQCGHSEYVKMGASRQCTAPARSAVPTHFHFSPGKLIKGHQYRCDFLSAPGTTSLNYQLTHFPIGATYKAFTPDNQPALNVSFPLTLNIDTTDMRPSDAELKFAYEVSPSDIPPKITAQCQQTS